MCFYNIKGKEPSLPNYLPIAGGRTTRFIPLVRWPSWLGLQNTPSASLQRRKTPHNECFGYETKQFDGEAPVMLELRGMWSTSLLSLLTGPLWPGVVAPDRVLAMGK